MPIKKHEKIFSQFKKWLETKSIYADYTISTYTRWINYFLSYCEDFNITKLNDVDNGLIYKFTSKRLDKKTGKILPYAKNYTKSRIAALEVFFSWAYENGYCRENPITRYKKWSMKTRTIASIEGRKPSVMALDVLSPKEQKQLLQVKTMRDFSLVRDKCIVLLILASAIFAEELISLPTSALYLKKGYLRVGSEGKRLRKASIDIALCEQACNDWLAVRDEVLGNDDFPLLFFSTNLLPLSKRMLYKIVSEFLTLVNIAKKDMGPDMLRQSAILNFFRSKLPIEEIQVRTTLTLETLEKYNKLIQLEEI